MDSCLPEKEVTVMGSRQLVKLCQNTSRQKGLTLIEIMIALLLGAFLIGGVMQIFVNARQTYRMQQVLSRLQENGRFAMDFMGASIRSADYVLCPSRKPITTAGVQDAITGTNGPTNGVLPDSPDTIRLRRWPETCTTVSTPTNTAYAIATPTGSATSDLQQDGSTLIEGVENMQIEYGYDTNNDNRRTPNYYAPYTGANLDQIVAVRVSLLLYTIEDNVLDVPATVTFNNQLTTPSRRLRRIFTSTFALRNRIP
jgi:type IV pilus assembly protein PilW